MKNLILIFFLFFVNLYYTFPINKDILWVKFSNYNPEGSQMAYSPDGKYFVIASGNKIVVLDAINDSLINIIPNTRFDFNFGTTFPSRIFFLQNSNKLLVDYFIDMRIYEIPSGSLLEEYNNINFDRSQMGITNDGKFIIEQGFNWNSENVQNKFFVKELETNEIVYQDTAFIKDTTNEQIHLKLLDVSKDNRYLSILASYYGGNCLNIFDLIEKKLVWHDTNTFDHEIRGFFDNDNNLIAVGDKILYCIDFLNNKIIRELDLPEFESNFYILGLSNNNLPLLIINYQSDIYLINYVTGKVLSKVFIYDFIRAIPGVYITSWMKEDIAISNNDSCLVVKAGCYILKYDIYSNKLINMLSGGYNLDTYSINNNLKFIKNDSQLVVTGWNGTVFWDSKTGHAKYCCDLNTQIDYGRDVDYMSNKDIFVYKAMITDVNDKNILFFNYSKDSISKFLQYFDKFNKLILSNNDLYISTMMKGGNYKVYNAYNLDIIIGDSCYSMNGDISFSSDNRYLIVSDTIYTTIWDVGFGEKIKRFSPNTYKNLISKKGKFVIGLSENSKELIIIDPKINSPYQDFDVIGKISHNSNPITDFCLSTDGNFIISCAWDSSIKVTNIISGKLIKEFKTDCYQPVRVTISRNGDYIASTDFDESLIVWDNKGVISNMEDNIIETDNDIILQSSPNPFSESTTIKYSLPSSSHVKLSLYDIFGREVAVIVDGWQDIGEHIYHLPFNIYHLSDGIYFCRLQAGGETKVIKIVKIE